MSMNMKRSFGLASLMLLGLFGLTLWGTGVIGPSGQRPDAGGSPAPGLIPSAFADPTPDCPAVFSQCDNTFGRRCNFSTQCTITDTGNHKCKQPTGGNFVCPGGQTVHVQDCPCREVFHNTCCDDDTCGPCPACESQPGSQSFFCL